MVLFQAFPPSFTCCVLHIFSALLLQPLPFQQQKGGVMSDCDQFKDMSAAMTTMAMAAALCSVLLYEWAPAAAETIS